MITSQKHTKYNNKSNKNNNNNSNNNKKKYNSLTKIQQTIKYYKVKNNKQFLLQFYYLNSKIKGENYKFKRLNHEPTKRLTTLKIEDNKTL